MYCAYMNFQVLRDFKRPDNTTEKEIDAAGDGNNYCKVHLR